MARRTIARDVTLEGPGLHEGQPARLVLRPAAPGVGFRVRRTDLAGSPPIPIHISRREERPRRTALVLGGAEVHTVEHLMAAASGLGLTDLEVEIDRVEMPGLDGSAREFAEAIRAAGVQDLPGEPPVLRLDRVVEVSDSGARIVAMPCPGRLVLDYTLDYGGACPRSRVEVEVTEERFLAEIAPARTFCLEQEALALRAAGLGKGATTRNTLVIGQDGLPLENELRFPDEYARHKALDLLGDLSLLGARLEARVIAYKAGHALNAALVRELAKLLAAPAAARWEPPAEAFEGHFPGDPVLPGIAMLAALRGGEDLAAIEGVKFRRVVRPGEALALERTPAGAPAPGVSEGGSEAERSVGPPSIRPTDAERSVGPPSVRPIRLRARATVGGEVAVDAVLVRRDGGRA